MGLAAVIAAGALGRAVQIANGTLRPEAVLWLTIGLAVSLIAILAPRRASMARLDNLGIPLLATGALIANFVQLYTGPAAGALELSAIQRAWFDAALLTLTLLTAALIWTARWKWASLLVLTLAVALHFAIGVFIIHHVPQPYIDVHVFQRYSILALRTGHNPYELTFPNIYQDESLYGPGLVVRGRLQFGFPYPPLSLLLAAPGQLIAGDHRYSQLVAIELAALTMVLARPRAFGGAGAAVFLTTPRVFFVLEQAWTEPFVVLSLAVLVFAACRWRPAVPALFGLFVALKQYMVLAIALSLLLVRRPIGWKNTGAFLGQAVMVSAAATLPLFLWSPAAFWKSVVTLQMYQPFRLDALSYLAWWANQGNPQPSAVWSFVAAAVVSALALWRLPRTAGGFAAAVAVTYFAFFAFNKQAFCNYYFFVIGAFCTTVSAWQPVGREA